jgi:hypothetical protein
MFEDEVNELIDTELDSWTYHPDADGYDANLWFAHTPSEDKPPGQPLSFAELQRLNEAYGVVSVHSASDGMTGSKLCVRIADP